MDKEIIKKNLLIGISLVISMLIIIKFIPFKEKIYYINEDSYITIPKLSIFKDDIDDYDYKIWYENGYYKNNGRTMKVRKILFLSFSSKMIVEINLDKGLDNYNSRLCNNDYYIYYDKENKISILDYGVEKGLLFNKYYIHYAQDYVSDYDCRMITNPNKVEYTYNYDYFDKNKNYDIDNVVYQYLNKDGKKYDVHSDCVDCIMIKNGMGNMTTLHEMLQSNYIDMKTIIDSLEEDVSNKKTERIEYDNGIMYKNEKLTLLNCNNKEVYISDKLEYSDKLCR